MTIRDLAGTARDQRSLALQIAPTVIVCLIVFAVPLFLASDFAVNRVARYVVFGILAMSLSLSWGYAGILNLGNAMSFGLGSYAMAMTLKLKTVPIQTGADGLPDFMTWNNLQALPWFWVPFRSTAFAIAAGLVAPAALAAALAWFMFRGRVAGVYVAIITLASMVVANLLIIDQQPYTGGFNGITDLSQLDLFGVTFDAYGRSTYYLVAACAALSLLAGFVFVRTKAGLIVQAIRDHESRVRFFGYDVASYKIFAFSLSAMIAGLAGMLYTVVMEFASPTFLGVPLSLSVVVWCAVGGRQSLAGAFVGAVLVSGVQGALSETPAFLDVWTLIMGALFLLVVLFLPKGLAGLAQDLASRLFSKQAPTARTPVAGRSAETHI
jgi:urea transport system permease protein